MESNHRKAMLGAGWGRVIIQPVYNKRNFFFFFNPTYSKMQ